MGSRRACNLYLGEIFKTDQYLSLSCLRTLRRLKQIANNVCIFTYLICREFIVNCRADEVARPIMNSGSLDEEQTG